MRRHLFRLAVAGLLGSLLLAGDARACCFKKHACQPCAQPSCAPAPEPAPAPAPEPAACPPPKKCCFRLFGCFRKKAVCYTPVVYYAPQPCPMPYPSGQYASPQY